MPLFWLFGRFSVGVLIGITVLAGCASPLTPSPVHYPITSGFHKTLPQRDMRILVWGKQPMIGTATVWLQRHGVTVILPDLFVGSYLLSSNAGSPTRMMMPR